MHTMSLAFSLSILSINDMLSVLDWPAGGKIIEPPLIKTLIVMSYILYHFKKQLLIYPCTLLCGGIYVYT